MVCQHSKANQLLDLTAKALPDTIEVNGRAFLIKTDHHTWLKVERLLKAHKDFNAGFIFKNEWPTGVDKVELLKAIIEFARPKNELPRQIRKNDAIAIDFDIDADLIYSAFMEQYGIDLIDEDLHYHKFLALLNGLNDNTTLRKIMGYRCYERAETKTDPYEELKRAWWIDPPLTQQEEEELEKFSNLFK